MQLSLTPTVTEQPKMVEFEKLDLAAKVSQLKQFIENPCFDHFLNIGEGSEFHRSVQLILTDSPKDIREFFVREQTIGEARALAHVHGRIISELQKLELDSNPEKKQEYERRNAVEFSD